MQRITPLWNKTKRARALILGLLAAPVLVCCIVIFFLAYRPRAVSPPDPSAALTLAYQTAVASLSTQPAQPGGQPVNIATPSTAETYHAEYGGNLEVYNRILDLTDCAELQSQFDQAFENQQRETPGTAAHKWTLGYMVAANDRMQTLGCN